MKSRFAFALVIVGLIKSGILAQTFQPTSGVNAWNEPLNWSPQTVPNSNTAAATISPTTGPSALQINLVDPIIVNTLTFNKTGSANFNVTVGEGTQTLTFDGTTPKITNGSSGTATGQTILSAPIALNATLTVEQNDPNVMQFTQPITGGTNGLTISRVASSNSTGAVVLGAANSYTGTTALTNGSTNQNYLLVRLNDTNAIPGGLAYLAGTSNLTISGSVIMGLSASDFNRSIGTTANTFQFTNQTGNTTSGWAAFGQDRAVNLFGDARRVAWGSAVGSNPPIGLNLGTLILGHNLADKTIDFQNSLDLTTSSGSVSRTIRIANGSAAVDANISGAIVTTGAGPGNLTFTGSSLGDGTLSLTGANPNTWNGTTTISSGITVRLEKVGAIPSGSNLTLASNGIVGLGAGNDTFTRALATTGSNTVQFTSGGGFAAFGGPKTVNLGGAGATVTWGTAPFIPLASNSLTLGDSNSDAIATLDFQNGIVLNTAATDHTVLTPDGSGSVDAKISGIISGAGNVKKSNPGTLEISNANIYTGTTNIFAGTLLLTNPTSIPGGIAGTNTNSIVFTGTAENPVPTLGLGQGDLSSELNTTLGAGHINLGTIAGFAAYGGNRVVNFKQSNVTQPLVWGTTGGFVTGSVLGLSASGSDAMVDLQNAIDLAGGARRIKVANGTASIDGTLSGVISDSVTGGTLTKDGGGTLKVTAANTYDGGTTIIAGPLLVSNSTGSGTGSGPVAVNAGTLGGTGSISGTVTVASGAHIAPGESIESLDAGSLILNAGSILDFELGAPGSPGITSDLINVLDSNGLTLNGGSVALTNAGGLAAGTYTLIDYAGSLGGNVANLGTPTGPAGFTYALSNNTSNTSIDLQVTALGLPGDFNSDGKVDAGDYVTWRKNDGTNNALANDNGLGIPVGTAHYNLWRANFGNPPGSGSGVGDTGAVPEPAVWVLLWLVVPLVGSRRRSLTNR